MDLMGFLIKNIFEKQFVYVLLDLNDSIEKGYVLKSKKKDYLV
jgi:hypothetical protein